MFFADERDSDKVAFSPDSEKGQPNVFSFEDETYKTGTFYRADDKEFPLKSPDSKWCKLILCRSGYVFKYKCGNTHDSRVWIGALDYRAGFCIMLENILIPAYMRKASKV
ncbi:MAG: hypothetical protein H0X72_18800 [Acidobacteria bacterium]|jgi:hypothetical protein|nr:hypothetical protein [Acidobacteriota bacterium]